MTRSDRVFCWLADHPRATGFILAAAILAVGYFDTVLGAVK